MQYAYYCWDNKIHSDPLWYMNLDEKRKAVVRVFIRYKIKRMKQEKEAKDRKAKMR